MRVSALVRDSSQNEGVRLGAGKTVNVCSHFYTVLVTVHENHASRLRWPNVSKAILADDKRAPSEEVHSPACIAKVC